MGSHPRKNVGVLLVDDSSPVLRSLAQLLEDAGMAVCGQTDGRRRALELAGLQAPELAVVDVSLGGDDGLALVAELDGPGIRVVACLSHGRLAPRTREPRVPVDMRDNGRYPQDARSGGVRRKLGPIGWARAAV